MSKSESRAYNQEVCDYYVANGWKETLSKFHLSPPAAKEITAKVRAKKGADEEKAKAEKKAAKAARKAEKTAKAIVKNANGKAVEATAKAPLKRKAKVAAEAGTEKRKPGRPKKVTAEASAPPATEKRKPGRPKKVAEATADVGEKRKPGRPKGSGKKNPLSAATVATGGVSKAKKASGSKSAKKQRIIELLTELVDLIS